MSYTKGKWIIKELPNHHVIWAGKKVITRVDLRVIAKEEWKANAKRIVHCVNNYDGLVEALKWVAPHSYASGKTFGDVDIIKQALAKTEEE